MNFTDLILCVLSGFAIPSAIAAVAGRGAYATVGRRSDNDATGLLFQWMLAFVCGPALLGARLWSSAAGGRDTSVDLVLGVVAATGWAALYGDVLLGLVQKAIA